MNRTMVADCQKLIEQPLAALENSEPIGGKNRVPHHMGYKQKEEDA